MMRKIAFLTVDRVVAIQRRMIEEFGGDEGIRDHGLLESAVAMPAASFGGEYLHDGIPAMAAAQLFHLCKNHAFVDGNKRVALAATEVFLLLNEWNLAATNNELEELTLAVAASEMSKDDLTAWMRKHTRPRKRK